MILKEITHDDAKRLVAKWRKTPAARALQPFTPQAPATAEQIIKRDGLAALNIRIMTQLVDVSINTLKRWALRDPGQFSELVQKTNSQLADQHAENAVGVLVRQLGTGYCVRQDVADGVMKLGVYRVDVPSVVFVITCSYDAPDCYLRAKAQQAKGHLENV
jgi:hypothetical protein